MNESDIQNFWNRNPCGDWQVGGLEQRRGDYEAFFTDYDKFRYTKEAHILRCLNNFDFKGKKFLEIGLGQGADSEQVVKRGALWSGLDLTTRNLSPECKHVFLCGSFPISRSNKEVFCRLLLKIIVSILYSVMAFCIMCQIFSRLSEKFIVS